MDELNQQVDELEQQVDELEQQVEDLDQRVDELEAELVDEQLKAEQLIDPNDVGIVNFWWERMYTNESDEEQDYEYTQGFWPESTVESFYDKTVIDHGREEYYKKAMQMSLESDDYAI